MQILIRIIMTYGLVPIMILDLSIYQMLTKVIAKWYQLTIKFDNPGLIRHVMFVYRAACGLYRVSQKKKRINKICISFHIHGYHRAFIMDIYKVLATTPTSNDYIFLKIMASNVNVAAGRFSHLNVHSLIDALNPCSTKHTGSFLRPATSSSDW